MYISLFLFLWYRSYHFGPNYAIVSYQDFTDMMKLTLKRLELVHTCIWFFKLYDCRTKFGWVESIYRLFILYDFGFPTYFTDGFVFVDVKIHTGCSYIHVYVIIMEAVLVLHVILTCVSLAKSRSGWLVSPNLMSMSLSLTA